MKNYSKRKEEKRKKVVKKMFKIECKGLILNWE
jgi:hypothetical protein